MFVCGSSLIIHCLVGFMIPASLSCSTYSFLHCYNYTFSLKVTISYIPTSVLLHGNIRVNHQKLSLKLVNVRLFVMNITKFLYDIILLRKEIVKNLSQKHTAIRIGQVSYLIVGEHFGTSCRQHGNIVH